MADAVGKEVEREDRADEMGVGAGSKDDLVHVDLQPDEHGRARDTHSVTRGEKKSGRQLLFLFAISEVNRNGPVALATGEIWGSKLHSSLYSSLLI